MIYFHLNQIKLLLFISYTSKTKNKLKIKLHEMCKMLFLDFDSYGEGVIMKKKIFIIIQLFKKKKIFFKEFKD